ncbi:putative pentatricopeptide repeat-containing protein At1g12700, mitochondrial [Daucus carota subsp. sativus]|nr:PREDICTED: putative pentatricopeptide repeat-containing protein At1g12700, mitochondrial [Daucus carota subsp. sativus]
MRRLISSLSLSTRKPHFLLLYHLHHTQTKPTQSSPIAHLNPSPIDPLNYLLTFIPQIKALSENPRNKNALTSLDSLLGQAHFLDSAASLIVIQYLCEIKKLGRAKDVFLKLKSEGKLKDCILFSLVYDCLVANSGIHDVEVVWNELCGNDLKIDVCDYVVYVCKFCGREEIKGIFERVVMGGRVLRRESYGALIGALCRENEGELGKEVMRVMGGLGIEVDCFSYYVLFRCFCRNGNVDEADWVLRELVKREFYIDICVYGNFLYGLCKTGKFREAKKLFLRLTKQDGVGGYKNVDFLKEGRRVIFQLKCEDNVPNILAYESYFRSLCDIGRLDEAEVLLKKMMNSRIVPEICVYGSFIKALFAADRDKDAIRFLQVEKKKGLVKVDEIASYVIKGLCQKRKLDEAVRIFDETSVLGEFLNRTNICNCILGNYWKEGRSAEAENLFRRLKEGNYGLRDASTYEVMINGYCNQSNGVKALLLFQEMVDRKIIISCALYEVIIRALCSCGSLREALKYLNDMVESGNMVYSRRWKIFISSTFAALEHG